MHFDEAQTRIVAHGDGNALVLAGAGSGKTACCVERTVRRIGSGVAPERMLILTFTNKAAREARERIAARLGEGARGPTTSTFHSFGHRFVRKHPEACGRRPRPSLMNESDAKDMLSGAVQQRVPEYRKTCEPMGAKECLNAVLKAHDLIRSAGLEPATGDESDRASAADILRGCGVVAGHRELFDAFALYDRRKGERNLLDFDDLILLPARALRSDPELAGEVRRWWKDITVDEAQDNNGGQYELLRLIAGPKTTVTMVGDDDQAIYRFRGAAPENLRRFREEFRPVEYRLERNYRSGPAIVDCATRLVRCNVERLEKNPYAASRREPEKPIRPAFHDSGDEMAERIGESVAASIAGGLPPDRIAVLYRVNGMARAIEPALVKRGIPYFVKAGTALMDRREIKMLIAAARLAVNPHDAPAFLRLTELIPFVGEVRAREAIDARHPEGILAGAASGGKTGAVLAEFRRSIECLHNLGPGALIAWALGPGGFREWSGKIAGQGLKAAGVRPEDRDYAARLEQRRNAVAGNLKVLRDTIRIRVEGVEDREEQWEETLDILCSPPDGEDKLGVTLSTVHGAKGLQWDTVHVAGFSDGLMPHERNGFVEDIEEERRLAYVAMTRAERHLMLHHAEQVFLSGRYLDLRPSVFLEEAGLQPEEAAATQEDFVGIRP